MRKILARSLAGAVAAASLALAAGMAHAQSFTPATDPATADQSLRDGATVAPLPPPSPRLTIAPEEDPPPRLRRRTVQDPYAPPGLRLGGILLHPSLGVGALASSNIQQAPNNAKADVGLSLKPSIAFASDWSRHSWTGEASVDFLRYLHNPGIKADTADAATALRLDIRHDTFATFDAGYTLARTGLGSSQIPVNAIGTRADQTFTAGAGVIRDYGPLQASLKAGVAYYAFGDVKLSGGGTQSNADRDNLAPSLTFRATYTDPPAIKPYAEVGYTPKFYDRTRDSAGLKRSSQGVRVSAGVVIDDSPIWQGDVAVTYLRRSYDDPTLAGIGALGLVGNIAWSPTELTNVVLGFGTDLSDNVGSTTSADRVWSAKLGINQALRDNVALQTGAGINVEQVSGGYDKTYSGNLGLEWKLNPEFAWTAGYDFTWLAAASKSRDYVEHKVSLGLVYTR